MRFGWKYRTKDSIKKQSRSLKTREIENRGKNREVRARATRLISNTKSHGLRAKRPEKITHVITVLRHEELLAR